MYKHYFALLEHVYVFKRIIQSVLLLQNLFLSERLELLLVCVGVEDIVDIQTSKLMVASVPPGIRIINAATVTLISNQYSKITQYV